jgi:hypothetical protein
MKAAVFVTPGGIENDPLRRGRVDIARHGVFVLPPRKVNSALP